MNTFVVGDVLLLIFFRFFLFLKLFEIHNLDGYFWILLEFSLHLTFLKLYFPDVFPVLFFLSLKLFGGVYFPIFKETHISLGFGFE